MASPTRQAVEAALYALIPSTPTFATKARILQLTTLVGPGAQPAVYLVKPSGQADTWVAGPPVKRVWTRLIIVYARAAKTVGWDTIIDPLIESIEDALAPDPMTGRLTLGGLVYDCRIDGDGIEANADVDPQGQGSAVIPVKIYTP